MSESLWPVPYADWLAAEAEIARRRQQERERIRWSATTKRKVLALLEKVHR